MEAGEARDAARGGAAGKEARTAAGRRRTTAERRRGRWRWGTAINDTCARDGGGCTLAGTATGRQGRRQGGRDAGRDGRIADLGEQRR
ncbi:hypothetical protein Scep_021628 [Stephania cephalantha]|uniref:Uncharacterized protein n=1 Tax=Stephania cephalantha TaxID=152367 RepID=A0AAP0FEA5_9MAGN